MPCQVVFAQDIHKDWPCGMGQELGQHFLTDLWLVTQMHTVLLHHSVFFFFNTFVVSWTQQLNLKKASFIVTLVTKLLDGFVEFIQGLPGDDMICIMWVSAFGFRPFSECHLLPFPDISCKSFNSCGLSWARSRHLTGCIPFTKLWCRCWRLVYIWGNRLNRSCNPQHDVMMLSKLISAASRPQ